MSLLFSENELLAAKKRIVEREAEKSAGEPAPAFEYKPRTPAQHFRRMRQSYRNNQSFVPPKPEPEPIFDEPKSIDSPDVEDDGNDGETRKAKITATSMCICGHQHSEHHVRPESHVTPDGCSFYCITNHCSVFAFRDGRHEPCGCPYFRTSENEVPKLTKPRVGDFDLCAACAHWKKSHCVKHKAGLASRLKPGELAYRIMQKPNGVFYGCRHFRLNDANCQCDSTACSHTSDGVNFCECERFVSPYLKKKGPTTPRKPRKKKTAFRTGGELFPPETATEVNP
jgi:hypothetical protein